MIRTMAYINKRFTEKVAEYLQAGMTIHTESMSGTQGEMAKIDLTDGKSVYRIILLSTTDYTADRWGRDAVEINILKYDKYEGRILWNNQGEVIYSKTYYKIAYRVEVYVDTKEEIEEINKKQVERAMNRDNRYAWKQIEIRPAYLDKIRDMCRANRGYGKVKRNMIASLEKNYDGEYRVNFTADSGKGRLIIKKMGGRK